MKKKAMGTKPIEASSMGTTEAKPINGFQLSTTEARTRLAQHASVLQAFGYFDISTLGKLTLGIQGQPTTLLQKSGALFPTTKPHPFEDKMEMLSGTVRMNAKLGKVETISGAAWVTASKNLPVPSGGKMATKSLIPINVAYWFGTNIVLPDDTKVVIDASVKSLFIIANTLTIGQRVSISWAEPPATWADVPRKPGTPEDWNTIQADGLSSERGKDGSTGLVGGQGPNAQSAPEIELWFLQSTGFPEINLRGQDGFIGVRGGDGGDGGRGQKGCNTQKKYGGCSQEQGQGGDGGNGGRSGDGGIGGNGGIGGKFAVFAPQAMINSWLQGGLTISVDGGNGGAGGDPGQPGQGGDGGAKGDHLHTVCGQNNRTAGQRGYTGASGVRGVTGKKGDLQLNSIQYSPITVSDFNIELTKPAIVSVYAQTAYVGDTVSINGLRFLSDDKVFIEGYDGNINVPCVTTFVSSTLLTFVVPNVTGGYAMLEVVQSDNTRSSSKGTLMIRPKIDVIIPSGRIRPGESYFIKGTGLGRQGNIWINGEGTGAFVSIDNNTIKFKARRPSNAEYNPEGERVKLKVINAEGADALNSNHSTEIDAVLDTYRILVFGDSVMWGGGLPEPLKYYSLAADYVSTRMEKIGVYPTIKAHHGAKIGRGDNTTKDELPGEMSTRFPTILQQVNSLSPIPDALDIDLIIINGGANDLPITDVMLLSKPSQLEAEKASLTTRTRQYCFDDMIFMLQKVVSQFPKAKVIVTGYFHIFSEESHSDFVQKALLALIDGLNFTDSIAETQHKIIELCKVWVVESNKNLSQAVTQINSSIASEPRVFFVDPQTTPSNAAHAPQSFLWEPDTWGGPTDPMWKNGRQAQRDIYADRLKSEKATLGSGFFMTRGNSSYHPNPAGAQRYFQRMKPILELATTSKRIALRCSTGHYLCAEGGGNGVLNANRQSIGAWETFDMIDLGSNKVALKSVNGFYVCANNGGGSTILVNRLRAAGWETFTLVTQPTGVAFKTATGHFLSATSGGGSNILASATLISAAEIFQTL